MSEKKHAFSPESMNKDSKDKKKIKFKKRVKLLIKQYPNDLELGKAVRAFMIERKSKKEQPKKTILPVVDKNRIENYTKNK
jgi:hypothetical protein